MSAAAPADPANDTRCFLALLPDAAGVLALQRCRASVERAITGATRGVRWLDPASLHLTLRFLGASSSAQIEYLKHILPTLASGLPALAGLRYGVWPNRARPRMLVLELAADASLSGLVHECEMQARKAGFEPEPRGFRAHVTLARLRPGCGFGILPNPPSALTFDTIALMRSTLVQPSATYTELARASLTRAAP